MGGMTRGGLALILGLLGAADARANGLTTHVYITREAAERVPPGPLADLVRDPALQDALLSGTIFPDGGYAVGDGYGERAHWEPFQLAFLEALRARYRPPWSDEAKQHIAFLLGMTSHGMADQVFDSLYMERARQHDHASDWANLSMDEATDVAFAAEVGAQPVPERFLPAELVIEVFEGRGHRVAEDTLHRGQSLAGFAVAVVGMLGEDRDAVRDYRAQFPWATAHLSDVAVPGTPGFEADVVAAYWAWIWARLHGEAPDRPPVLAAVPRTGSYGHARDPMRVESRVSIIFAQRLLREDAAAAALTWSSPSGAAVPFGRRLFYGDDSHVLHLSPEAELAAYTAYTVTVPAGLRFADGAETRTPIEVTVDTSPPPEIGPPDLPVGCRCHAPGAQGGVALTALCCLLALRRGPKRRFRR